ncbi:tyrosine-type recombinase/integrase [Tabrizicola fusiformis]|uniref:tyrosine-type recombinase/integrase n=1 Tax=Tabrizicola sp. SY72 TaxID=2741673 RepID=UPI0015716241|nr:tyrosine-type recombinase/integrase [Tabrizicola sp. SY72]NTT87766.1 integrase family protein [Tabrizicola sp. SY72]
MPQIRFTDTAVAKLKADAMTWYSDPGAKGLQLSVTPGGTKTWYVVKWDPATQKTRRVKLGQWAPRGMHCAWAKDQVGKVMLDVKEGKVATKAEKAVERAGVPTLREAFDKEMGYRRARPASLGGAIHARTDDSYTRAFDKYLATWADDKMDEIDTAAIQRALDDLVNEKPFAAHKVNVVLGITFKRAERMLNKRLPTLTPKLATLPKMQKRKIDFSIPWADRWAEIEQVENEHKRLLWKIRWFTGQRETMLRALTWADIDLDAGTMMATTGQKKVKEKRLIAMADQVKEWFQRLREIRFDDCDWVFPSRRIVGDARGPLDQLDDLPLSDPGDMRHLWDEATHDVDTREMVLRWLTGHVLSGGETRSLGFYGTVPVERQRKVANAIASVINKRIGLSPANVIEIRQATA